MNFDLVRRWIGSLGSTISLWTLGSKIENLGVPEIIAVPLIIGLGMIIGIIVWGDYRP